MTNTRTPITKREPVLSVGSISALVSAVLALIVVLGVSLPEGFEAALLGVIAAGGPIVAGLITRSKVWSDESHRADKAKAIDETARAYGYKDLPDADA